VQTWIDLASGSEFPELRGFANGLRSDFDPATDGRLAPPPRAPYEICGAERARDGLMQQWRRDKVTPTMLPARADQLWTRGIKQVTAQNPVTGPTPLEWTV
jgi:hypothetical protein